MRVSIYTINKTLFDGDVEVVIVKTATGEIAVYDNHIPIISRIVHSPLILRDKDGKETSIPISSGFIEVQPGHKVTILADF